jgi:hypothetical protein
MMAKMTRNRSPGEHVVEDRVVVAKEADNISVAVDVFRRVHTKHIQSAIRNRMLRNT